MFHAAASVDNGQMMTSLQNHSVLGLEQTTGARPLDESIGPDEVAIGYMQGNVHQQH